MQVEELVKEIGIVRRNGVKKPNLLCELDSMRRVMERYWPTRDVAELGHYLEEFLRDAANVLDNTDKEGIHLALGIGELSRESSAERREMFAVHYSSTSETVRRRPGGLESQAFTKFAKAILELLDEAERGREAVAYSIRPAPPLLAQKEVPSDIPILTSRERARYVIAAFLRDLQSQIEQHLLKYFRAEDVFHEEYGRLSIRQDSSETLPMTPLTYFLLPHEAYEILLRHSKDLPPDLIKQLNANFPALQNVVPVFNRITRTRPLQPDDLDETEELLKQFQSQLFPESRQAVQQLTSDLTWQPWVPNSSISFERTIHNLPSPEFDETGLLGREKQIQQIMRLVKRRREPITLLGEGGIGKTALALEVCYRLADEPEPLFEVILWASLKSEQLTPAGIRELSRTITDIDGVVGDLGKAVGGPLEADVDSLISALGGRTTLIVIDNLESNLGEDVVELYDNLPPTVALLFTSRRGLGQIDRPISVGPLEHESAAELFRKFARSRGLSLFTDLSAEALDERLRQLRYSPLAIRWYILSVEAGKTPSDTLGDQRELLRFCVGNVVGDLSVEQRLLISVFRAFDRPVSFVELAVISDIDPDILRRGVQELRQASLVVLTRLQGDKDTDGALQLSSSARAYLPVTVDSEVAEEIIQREADYRKEREKDRNLLAERGRYFDPNVVYQRSSEDGAIALLLGRALREMKLDNPAGAVEVLRRARAINASFFEIDRIEAFFASKRREPTRATALYRSSLNNCEAVEERQWVSYFYAAHLARVPGSLSEAVNMAEQTHEFFHRYDTAHALGRYLYWDKRFDEGEALIRWSLGQSPTPEFHLQATTSLVECFRQRSEEELFGSRPEPALEHATEGIRLGLDLHETNLTDNGFMHAIVRVTVVALRALHQLHHDPGLEMLAEQFNRLTKDPGFRDVSIWSDVEYSVAALPEQVRTAIAPRFVIPDSISEELSGPRLRGTVRTILESYGFIEHPNFPGNIYFRANSLLAPTWIEDLTVGAIVEFTPHRTSDERDQALNVMLCTGGTAIES